MPTEIDILCCAGLLLLVHILLPARFKTQQYGTKWNVGARDEVLPPLNPIAGRLERARDNFLETLPVAIIALVGAVLTNRTSSLTAIAGWTWLGARIAYLPNPRKEAAENDLVVKNDQFLALGLEPTTLAEGLLTEVVDVARKFAYRVDRSRIPAFSAWTRDLTPTLERDPEGRRLKSVG